MMMKAAVVVLVAMVATISAQEQCNILQRLNVKAQWSRAYSSGHDREHFAEAIFRALFAQEPEARSLFTRVRGDDTSSPNFRAHALRVVAALDIVINMLDQPEALRAELAHLRAQHEPRNVPDKYFQALRLALAHVLPAQLGRCFDKEPWKACFPVIAAGIRG